ncbi:MAG: hypothetical protein U9N34_10375 [Candidatus Cloacimonadota bacterium]|nr:hypothetical protein [Candidatus Cloacimonadota bacterium]
MPIDFFQLSCKTESNNNEFGLCDDSPPITKPAYIDEDDSLTWIAIVNNPEQKIVKFYAIDNCVSILKPDGNMESRCDGLLLYSNNLIFIELKSREGGQWLKKGRKQLTTIVKIFKSENDITDYDKVEAYVCNNLRPIAHTGQASNIQKFKDETGLILKGEKTINLN